MAPSEPATAHATLADLAALPAHLVGQILDGQLIASPRPATRHARAASNVHHAVGGPFDFDGKGPGGWWILFEPELHLDRDVLVPDLAGWRRTRLPELPDVAAMTLAPDWVCEVLSPSTQGLDRVRKRRIHARHGVGHVWLVEPQGRVVEVLRLAGDDFVTASLHEGDGLARLEPFDVLELDLARLWPA